MTDDATVGTAGFLCDNCNTWVPQGHYHACVKGDSEWSAPTVITTPFPTADLIDLGFELGRMEEVLDRMGDALDKIEDVLKTLEEVEK